MTASQLATAPQVETRTARKGPAVLLGLDTMQGLQAARILKKRGVAIIAITPRKAHYANHSNYCDQVLVVKGDEKRLAALESLAAGFEDSGFLLPCNDPSVRLVSQNRERLEGRFQFVLPPHEVVSELSDKAGLITFCQKHALPIPESAVIRTDADLEDAIKNVPFPCVFKPSIRTRAWIAATKLKALKIEDEATLRATWARCRDLGVPAVLQRWIEGGDSALYSCNAYFDRKGEMLASFVAKKLRQWPLETGQSSLGIECRDDEVLRITKEFFQAAGYCGLAYLEVKKELSSGRYYIIEPNLGRPTGRSAIAEAGGVDLLLTAYNDAMGLPPPTNRVQAYGKAKWIHLRRDTQAAWCAWRAGQLTIGEWLRSLRGVNSFAVWSLRDPVPFFVDLWHTFRSLWSRKERRRARKI